MTVYESIQREGEVKSQTETVHNLLTLGKLTVQEIAMCANVSVDFVRKIQDQLSKK